MSRIEQPGRREAVLRLLRDIKRPAGTTEVAESLGVHRNTARLHLEALVDTGQAERAAVRPAGPGRPPQMFRAVRGMDPTGPRNYRLLAEILLSGMATQPDAARSAEDAAHAWGAGHADAEGDPTEGLGAAESVDRLVELLDELGFAPEAVDEDGELPAIALHHCPFLELMPARTDLICPLHRELMRGALESWQAPVALAELVPFEHPDLCVTRLSHAAAL